MIKRIIAITSFVLLLAACGICSAADLKFEPRKGGKYIYSNNREFIFRTDLADVSNENAKFIMSNENMTPDKYTLFASHVNHTEEKDNNGLIKDKGFDIELDVMFKAREDTEILITALGFEVPENVHYYSGGELLTTEKEWGCFTAWASYLGTEISVLDSAEKYKPVPFTQKSFIVKAGETVYLSEYIPNYRSVPIWRPVHIMVDFEMLSGLCDINVFAVKSYGTDAGNRSIMSRNIAFGSFVPQYEMKGVANSQNHVDAYVDIEIPGNVSDGYGIPLTVYNRYAPNGNTVTTWYTNLNPTSDVWNKNNVAESCMLQFEYKDPSKKKYYGAGIPDEERSDVWYFDTNHVLAWEHKPDLNVSSRNFVPNFQITEYVPEEYCNSLGNYGVFQNYHITVTNNGFSDKWISYWLNTGANNLIILKDENGNYVKGYPLTKGSMGWKERDKLANIKVPARETVKYTLSVILTTNHPGGMENSFVVNDAPSPVKTYTSKLVKNVRDVTYTGKEYLKYFRGKLYLSEDGIDWYEQKISSKVMDIFDTSSEIRVSWTGSGYIVNNSQHSGIPYYIVRDYYRDVWVLDENFNLIWEKEFEIYPTFSSGAFDLYYIKAGSNYYTKDGKEWNLLGGDMNLPCYNYSNYAATIRNGRVCLSEDGIEFFDVIYENQSPLYIDALGDIYYYIDGRAIYVSAEGVYWTKIEVPCEVDKISKSGKNLIINDTVQIPLPEISKINHVLKFCNKYLGFKIPPVCVDGTYYIPLRTFAELVGGTVKWDSESSTALVTVNGKTAKFYKGQMYVDDDKKESFVYLTENTMMIPVCATDVFLFETEEN